MANSFDRWISWARLGIPSVVVTLSVGLIVFAITAGLRGRAAFRSTESQANAGPTADASSQPARAHVARLTALSADAAAIRPANLNLGATLAEGEALELKSGWAELRFIDGARIIVEGPAVFIPEGKNGGALKQGRLTTSITPGRVGFTLNMPHAKIVDLGAEFGVELGRDAQIDVHVLEGQTIVDYHHPELDAKQQVRLAAHQAARFAPHAPSHLKIPCEPDRFVRADDIPDPTLVWGDEFDREQLRADWTWFDPDDDDRFSLTDRPGYLRMHVGELEDAWKRGESVIDGAPYLFRSLVGLPEDFAVETLVDLRGGQSVSVQNSIGGLLVYDGAKAQMAVSLGLQNVEGDHYVVFHSLGKVHAEKPINGTILRLKLIRRGVHWFACYCQPSSDSWTPLCQVREDELSGGRIEDPRVGLIVKTWGTSPTNGASIDFKYFRATSPYGGVPEGRSANKSFQ